MENLIGRTLGKYRITAKLGKGGMAEVYKAYQPGLDRYVAIKVMHEYLSDDEEFVKRFQREALATARLSHPNIVQVLDFDQAGNLYFMVMQFINGPTLRDEFRARRKQDGRGFSLKEIGRIYQALGSAIDYAHQRDMVHRDLKPGNVMIDDDGQVLLTDFGIARLLDATQYTATGALIGTPAYMSPEQGRGVKVDGRSDIYTLGVILYELVTGKVPFDAPTPVAILMKHVQEPLPLPTSINARLPQKVEAVIARAMAKSPEERFQTGSEMAQALREAVDLPPGDTLRRHPLKTTAPPPQVDDELDPHTGSFTPVGLSTAPVVSEATAPIQPPPAQPVAPMGTPPPTAPASPQKSSASLLYGLVGLVVLAVAAGLGYFFWANATPPADPEPAPAVVVEAPTETPVVASGIEAENPAATATAEWLAGDDDEDGLSNGEEREHGTNPDRPDTDGDNLDDLAEVSQHNTDPLKRDTDGDSIPDGLEIRGGLDPLNGDTDGDGIFDASDPDPRNPPTPTPASTETPVDTPSPSLTPTATNLATEEPTVTPTAEATAAPTEAVVRAAGPGVFQNFESQSTWRRGDQANGTFSRSDGQTYGGSFAGQLDYDFPSAGNDFVVFLQSWPLSGQPTALTAWVYGDGAGHFLSAWIRDSAGQTWTMTFGQVSHTGWQQMTAFLDPAQPWPSGHIDGPDNGAIDYPITFQALTLDDGNDGFSGRGTIYIDDLASQEGTPAPPPTATPASGAGASTPVPKEPVVVSTDFQLKRGNEFNYVQPWGSPVGDVCNALKYDDWDDTQGIYRGLTIELLLTNNSTGTVPDDWGGVDYVTGTGQTGRFCRFEYAGSGPPPGETRSVTFFALMPIGDYIKQIRLANHGGQALDLCLNRDGTAC